MRAIVSSLVLATLALGLGGQASMLERAAGDHGHQHGQAKGRHKSAPKNNQTGKLILEYPTEGAFRSPYFFPASARAERTRDVRLYDNYFSPNMLWVQTGTEVRFNNSSRHTHTVTCDGLWESGDMRQGDSFRLTFTRTGTYYYYCRHHTVWMRGTIVVF